MARAFVGDLEVVVYKYENHLVWVKYPCFDTLLPVLDELIEVRYDNK